MSTVLRPLPAPRAVAHRSHLVPVMRTASLDESTVTLPGLFRSTRHWAERTTSRHLKPFVHGHWALAPVPITRRPPPRADWSIYAIAGATAGATFVLTVSLGGWMLLGAVLLVR